MLRSLRPTHSLHATHSWEPYRAPSLSFAALPSVWRLLSFLVSSLLSFLLPLPAPPSMSPLLAMPPESALGARQGLSTMASCRVHGAGGRRVLSHVSCFSCLCRPWYSPPPPPLSFPCSSFVFEEVRVQARSTRGPLKECLSFA